jgi:ketosteroid isomerase-like protein
MTIFTHGDAQDLLARYKRAWERRDVDLALSLFDADAEFRFDAFEPPLSGVNAIRTWWNATVAGIDHVDFDLERTWLSGETVLASFHAAWTDRATAERSRTRGFLTFELGPDGLVRRLRDWSRTKPVGTDATFHPEATATPMAG